MFSDMVMHLSRSYEGKIGKKILHRLRVGDE